MTRIMYWNIMDFGQDRFFCKKTKPISGGGYTDKPITQAKNRLDIVMSSLRAYPPDIFVIVEVNRGINELPEGSVVYDTSSLRLLKEIRKNAKLTPPGTKWHLVPPLISGAGGKAEGIAVFYKSLVSNRRHLHFIGPWGWPGGASAAGGNPVVANSTGSFGNYSSPWDKALPNRQVPNNSPFNAGQQENQLAGQYQFFQPPLMPPATPLYFPAAGYRSPFLTYFWDLSPTYLVPARPPRLIKLLSYHAPSEQTSNNAFNTAFSAAGTANLAQVQEMNTNITPNGDEVSVIVGDFNVSLFASYASAAYDPLTNPPPNGAGYTQAITRSVAGGTVQPNYPEKSYLITHIRKTPPADKSNKINDDFAAPWQDNGYPGYGYLSEPNNFGRYDAIDNIFTKYGAGLMPPANNNITIVNRVIGAPYTGVAAFPAGQPDPQRGHYVYTTAMGNPLALPVPPPVPPAPGPAPVQPSVPPGGPGGYPKIGQNISILNSFRGWNNYKKIYSTSDHMALIIDV